MLMAMEPVGITAATRTEACAHMSTIRITHVWKRAKPLGDYLYIIPKSDEGRQDSLYHPILLHEGGLTMMCGSTRCE